MTFLKLHGLKILFHVRDNRHNHSNSTQKREDVYNLKPSPLDVGEHSRERQTQNGMGISTHMALIKSVDNPPSCLLSAHTYIPVCYVL